jgi:hypothetical protein
LRTLLIMTLNFLVLAPTLGQGNLVQNSGFELISNCPYSAGQANFCASWNVDETPDLMDTCGTASFGVPTNYAGYQLPLSGKTYIGLVTFGFNPLLQINFREFIKTELTDSLKPGITYCIKFNASVADKSPYFSPNIGIHFSTDEIDPISWDANNNVFVIQHSASVENENSALLTDTSDWEEISLYYTASGGEKWLTIGNFRTDSNTVYSYFQTNNFNYTYLYVDNVSVFEQISADAGIDTLICQGDSIRLGPTPVDSISYKWTATDQIQDSLACNPWVTPSSTTTFYLTITDSSNSYCINQPIDSVTISVVTCDIEQSIVIPSLLIGESTFSIQALPANTSLNIYDMLGQRIYRSESYDNEWSAINASQGIYLYELNLPTGEIHQGKILVIK